MLHLPTHGAFLLTGMATTTSCPKYYPSWFTNLTLFCPSLISNRSIFAASTSTLLPACLNIFAGSRIHQEYRDSPQIHQTALISSIQAVLVLNLGLGWHCVLTLRPDSGCGISLMPQGTTKSFHNSYQLQKTLRVIPCINAPITPHMPCSLCILFWSVTMAQNIHYLFLVIYYSLTTWYLRLM